MAGATMAPAGVVGPNAVIQVGGALIDALGIDRARSVFAEAGIPRLLDHPPERMIDQAIAASLLTGLWQTLPSTTACAIAAEAGRRTADYVITHRIPRVARWLLAAAPPRLAAPLLLTAIRRNAWTFAGSGDCTVHRSPHMSIEISDNPLAMPGCVWHRAVFERLFHRLVAHDTGVRHTACCSRGAEFCRFEIDLPSRDVRAP